MFFRFLDFILDILKLVAVCIGSFALLMLLYAIGINGILWILQIIYA